MLWLFEVHKFSHATSECILVYILLYPWNVVYVTNHKCILMDYFDLRCENNMLHVLNYIIVPLNIAVANDS